MSQVLVGEIVFKMRADADQMLRSLRAAQAEVRKMQAESKAAAKASSEMDSAMGAAAKTVDKSTAAIERHTRAVDKHTSALQKMGKAGQAIPLMAVGIGALVTAAAPLVPVVAGGLLAVSAAAVTAGAGLGAFALFAMPAIKQVITVTGKLKAAQDALSNATTKAQYTAALRQQHILLKNLTPAQLDAANSLNILEANYKRIQKTLQGPIFAVFTSGLKVANQLLQVAAPIAARMSVYIKQVVDEIGKGLKTHDWVVFFNYIRTNAGPLFKDFAATIGNFITGFVNMIVAFDPVTKSFSGGMLHMSESFKHWSETLAHNTGFQNFIADVKRYTPMVMQLLGTLITSAWNLIRALQPIGAVIIPILTGILKVIGAISQWGQSNPDIFKPIVLSIFGLVAALKILSLFTGGGSKGMLGGLPLMLNRSRSQAALAAADAEAMAGSVSRLGRFGGAATLISAGGGIAGSMIGGTAGAALSGASYGASFGALAGPEGAAIGAVGGAIAGLVTHWATAKTASEKYDSTVRANMAAEESFIKQMGTTLTDALNFDGFKKGASYAQALFDSLKQTPGAISSMARFGLTIKDVQGFMDGNAAATARVTHALSGTGKEGDALYKTFTDLRQAQQNAISASDDQASVLGKVTAHMAAVSAATKTTIGDLNALSRIRANPRIDINSAEARHQIALVSADLNNLITLYGGAKSLAGQLVGPTIPGNRNPGAPIPNDPLAGLFNKPLHAGQANGSVLSFFANGGVRRENHVAQIAPAGAWRVWAEPETGGEAYIPLAMNKRARSLAILRQTAQQMGAHVEMYAGGGINPPPLQFTPPPTYTTPPTKSRAPKKSRTSRTRSSSRSSSRTAPLPFVPSSFIPVSVINHAASLAALAKQIAGSFAAASKTITITFIPPINLAVTALTKAEAAAKKADNAFAAGRTHTLSLDTRAIAAERLYAAEFAKTNAMLQATNGKMTVAIKLQQQHEAASKRAATAASAAANKAAAATAQLAAAAAAANAAFQQAQQNLAQAIYDATLARARAAFDKIVAQVDAIKVKMDAFTQSFANGVAQLSSLTNTVPNTVGMKAIALATNNVTVATDNLTAAQDALAKAQAGVLATSPAQQGAANLVVLKDALTLAQALGTSVNAITNILSPGQGGLSGLSPEAQAVAQAKADLAAAQAELARQKALYDPATIVSQVQASLDQTLALSQHFLRDLTDLNASGASKELLQQIVDMGPEAGTAFADALLTAGKSAIAAMNTTIASISSVATTGINQLAGSMWAPMLDSAAAALAALQTQFSTVFGEIAQEVNTILQQIATMGAGSVTVPVINLPGTGTGPSGGGPGTIPIPTTPGGLPTDPLLGTYGHYTTAQAYTVLSRYFHHPVDAAYLQTQLHHPIDLAYLNGYITSNHIPALAKGGIVTSPTLAMIGEAGKEAVIPLTGGGLAGLGLGSSPITVGNVYVTVPATAPGVTPDHVAAAVQAGITQALVAVRQNLQNR